MFIPDTDDVDFDALYTLHFNAMTKVATTKFHIPGDAAEKMAHDILVAAIHQSPRIQNPTKWFRGAIKLASRHYLRGRG
jgi:DNA-directed RNA polymerase specialized sigma24 family protein